MRRHVPRIPRRAHRLVAAEAAERERFGVAFLELAAGCDFVIIDTPGSNTHLSRIAHIEADTLLTPLNDSFIDLDLLARVEPDTFRIIRPSIYSESVWTQRQQRAAAGHRPVDWLVMRNRLASLDARNKREMERVVAALSQRLGFRVAPGLSERVIYRELFLKGLTLLDLREKAAGVTMTMSHVAARQELRSLLGRHSQQQYELADELAQDWLRRRGGRNGKR